MVNQQGPRHNCRFFIDFGGTVVVTQTTVFGCSAAILSKTPVQEGSAPSWANNICKDLASYGFFQVQSVAHVVKDGDLLFWSRPDSMIKLMRDLPAVGDSSAPNWFSDEKVNIIKSSWSDDEYCMRFMLESLSAVVGNSQAIDRLYEQLINGVRRIERENDTYLGLRRFREQGRRV